MDLRVSLHSNSSSRALSTNTHREHPSFANFGTILPWTNTTQCAGLLHGSVGQSTVCMGRAPVHIQIRRYRRRHLRALQGSACSAARERVASVLTPTTASSGHQKVRFDAKMAYLHGTMTRGGFRCRVATPVSPYRRDNVNERQRDVAIVMITHVRYHGRSTPRLHNRARDGRKHHGYTEPGLAPMERPDGLGGPSLCDWLVGSPLARPCELPLMPQY